MRTPPDHEALMHGLHTVVDQIGDGQAGLPVLTQLLSAAADALGAAGMSLSEQSGTEGRIVAGTGAMAWAVGRRTDPGIALPVEPTWDRVVDRRTGDSDDLPAQLHARGLPRLLGARIRRPGGPDSVLCAHFTERERAPEPAHHRVLAFVGSCVRAVYLHAEHLPVTPPAPPAAGDRDLLLAVASHELRTPVTVIKGYADTLLRHGQAWDPQAAREAVQVIGQRADELAGLVDRLLASAVEPDAGLACEPFDLVAALRGAVDGLAAQLRTRVRARLPGGLPAAYGDRTTVAPVLTELVTNAARHSSGEVTLLADADARTVRFRVADRGTGVAPEDVERAFARFWQAGADDPAAHTGAGLGLHLVRRIVERQQGWVSLRPRRSGGTVVEVRLLRSDVASTGEQAHREG